MQGAIQKLRQSGICCQPPPKSQENGEYAQKSSQLHLPPAAKQAVQESRGGGAQVAEDAAERSLVRRREGTFVVIVGIALIQSFGDSVHNVVCLCG